MWRLLRRLFGGGRARLDGSDEAWDERASSAYQSSATVDRYFELLNAITTAKADRDYPRAIRAARDTYPLLADFVREMKDEGDGEFNIDLIPAIDTAGAMMAVMGDRDGIAEMRGAVSAIPDLAEWVPSVEGAEEDLGLSEWIVALVAATPALKQSQLKTATGASDGRRVSTLARWLEEAGRLVRVRVGSTYELYPAGTKFPKAERASEPTSAPPATTMPIVSTRARHRRRAEKASLIDLARLPYVRLPIAPASWEAHDRRRRQGSQRRDAKAPLFEVVGADWSAENPVTLSKDERPDPAFKQAFHTGYHSYWVDPRGRSKGYETCPTVVRVTNRTGAVIAERGLPFDVYRADVNTGGSGILFLSRDGILHAYDHTLSTLLTERVADLPEYLAVDKRLGIPERELRNHVRCVALTNDRNHYLYTVVDEAWCIGRDDAVRWGLRMPCLDGPRAAGHS
jgi:hypothetical protein